MTQGVAIISGGSSGIGKAIAKRFALKDITVVLLARNEEKLKKVKDEIIAEGGNAAYIVADVTNTKVLKEKIKEVYSIYNKINILVNCAGGGPYGGIMDISEEEWNQNVNVKQQGYIRLTREILPYMIKSDGGCIINVIGVFGKQPSPDFIVGSVTNAALLAFTKAISDEVAKYNINVNAINPGATETELWKDTVNYMSDKLNIPADRINEDIAKSSPFKRLTSTSDIADVAEFLISDGAKFITGCSINVDGGLYRGIS